MVSMFKRVIAGDHDDDGGGGSGNGDNNDDERVYEYGHDVAVALLCIGIGHP